MGIFLLVILCRSSSLRRSFSRFFVLIHSCSHGKNDNQDNKDTDKNSENDKHYFPPSRSSGCIRSFYGICISDDFDIIIWTSITNDGIESKYFAHIWHDDSFHIQWIYLICLHLCTFCSKIFRDEVDDILKDSFSLILLRSVCLRSIGNDGFEFLEESFYVYGKIGW